MEPCSQFLGNHEILEEHKVGFLCSRKVPAEIILKTYDWAIEQREKGNCVVSGFHSKIEKDVLHYLLKGKQPIIVVLARGLYHKVPKIFQEPLEKNRLLIVTPFKQDVGRVTEKIASKRNEYILSLVNEVFIPYVSKGGSLSNLLNTLFHSNKKIYTLNIKENQHLLDIGILPLQ